MDDTDAPAVTRDAFFGGKLRLSQPATGHRSGTDAVLLAAAVPPDFAGLLYDVGAGVGAAGLAIASSCSAARVGLVENDRLVAALAGSNILANGLTSRATLHCIDVLSQADRRTANLEGEADVVVTNPPFHDPARVRMSPDAGRRAAHVEAVGGIGAWVDACLALLRTKGCLVLIHRVEAVPALLKALEREAGGITLLPIYAKTGGAAGRVVVRAHKGSRAPFRIAPALILHEDEAFTPFTEALHRGDAFLRW